MEQKPRQLKVTVRTNHPLRRLSILHQSPMLQAELSSTIKRRRRLVEFKTIIFQRAARPHTVHSNPSSTISYIIVNVGVPRNLNRPPPEEEIFRTQIFLGSARVFLEKYLKSSFIKVMAWRNLGSLFNFRGIFQGRTSETELGRYTIKSHGAALAKKHMHDWLILVLLGVIDLILFIIHPFHRFVGKDMMEDLRYPMKESTVPLWAVPMYSVLLPIAIFLFFYMRRKDVYDLHHSILGLLFAVLITGVITDAIKNAVGRPRPDFFWRCFPDGKDVYDTFGGVMCHGKSGDIKEGHKSFPSGSFAGLGFLSLYLCGKIKAFDRQGHVAKLCIVLLPLLAASLVGISRVDDYWHHWQDVFAGGLLGLVVASFCYRQFFPSPYTDQGWGPYAYFSALEETRSHSNPGVNPMNNALSVQVIGAQNVNEQHIQIGDALAAMSHNRYTSISLHEMESGEK
ncbi:hypothetical protein ACFX2I_020582 [Malus domestica]